MAASIGSPKYSSLALSFSSARGSDLSTVYHGHDVSLVCLSIWSLTNFGEVGGEKVHFIMADLSRLNSDDSSKNTFRATTRGFREQYGSPVVSRLELQEVFANSPAVPMNSLEWHQCLQDEVKKDRFRRQALEQPIWVKSCDLVLRRRLVSSDRPRAAQTRLL